MATEETPGTGAKVARSLPFLRRFSRAILGDQKAGDRTVAAVLQNLLDSADDGEFDDLTQAELTRRLFRELCATLNRDAAAASEAEKPAATLSNARIVDRRLHMLDLNKRQLLLLVKLERFSPEEAGEILDLTPEEARRLMDEALRELRQQQRCRVLIIEDEPLIALDIASIVETEGHVVVGVARTRAEAVTLAGGNDVELVLADIQLADDSSGLDAVGDILDVHDVPIIFITAFPERLLTGQRPEPAFLVTKPFDEETLAVSIAQAQASAVNRAA